MSIPAANERSTSGATRAGSAWSVIVVWGVWAATLASILVSIARHGRNIPFEEDWLMVGAMTGHEPNLPQWLWSQNSEHRLPLPRLINLALLRATGDFRSTMVFDTLALGAVAAAMLLAARRLRNRRTSVTDAFFPLALLHLGNWDNLVWAWQIQFVLPTVLACGLLVVIVAQPTAPGTGLVAAGALALVCLPLSGANGLLFAPILAAWFAYIAWMGRNGPDQRAASRLAAAAATIAVLLCGAYFVGYQASPWYEPNPGPLATLETAGKFVALSIGPVAAKHWPLFGTVAAAILLTSLGLLAAARRQWRDERVRMLGLVAFFAAALVLALAIGYGRAGRAMATGRMPTRYVLLAAPALCAAYFTALVAGQPWIRRSLPAALAALAALLFPLNTRVGYQRRTWFGAGFAAFERDLAAGTPVSVLAQRHHAFMLHWDESLMVTSLLQLRDARIGPFTKLQPDSGSAAAEPPRTSGAAIGTRSAP
jgi:hypothetical protein